jgi:hypothetical protein
MPKRKQEKRYEICSFPSFLGIPWKTNSLFIAYVFAIYRNIASFGCREIRAIDKRTSGHFIVW